MMVVLVSRGGYVTVTARYDRASFAHGELFAECFQRGSMKFWPWRTIRNHVSFRVVRGYHSGAGKASSDGGSVSF